MKQIEQLLTNNGKELRIEIYRNCENFCQNEEVLSEGSCVSDRRVVVRCQVCGDTLSEDVTPAPGHDYQDTGNTDSYKDTTSPPPSGQQGGSYWLVYIREQTCSRCGDTQWVEYDRVYVH